MIARYEPYTLEIPTIHFQPHRLFYGSAVLAKNGADSNFTITKSNNCEGNSYTAYIS